MCGITGFIDLTPDRNEHELRRRAAIMSEVLYHRGPDAGGVRADVETGLGLGHRRLAIIDLSPEGAQPMVSATGRYIVSYNGEIYNFLELRAELEAAGATFRGNSDTEVLLAGVEAWGLRATLQRSRGMFAFALWDKQERTLSLARDRVGEKPLYYAHLGKLLLFGSELKALRAHPDFSQYDKIDREALGLFLRHGYIPAPYTIYSNVRKLLPGTVLTVPAGSPEDLQYGLCEPEPYWSMEEVARRGAADPFPGTMEEAVQELENMLRGIVKERMISDVPLGAFLSGGIDSSTIVAMMQQVSDRPARTFTVGFWEKAYNEADHAKEVARHLGTEHTEMYVTPEDALAVIPLLPRLYDEPFADYSQIPTYLVSKLTREHVTVSLSADGGDEFFAGYNTYFWVRYIWDRVGFLPAQARQAFRMLKLLPPGMWNLLHRPFSERKNVGHKIHMLADIIGARTPEDLFLNLTRHWPDPNKIVRGIDLPKSMPSLERYPEGLAGWPARLQFFDSVRYLPDDILVKVDRASMGVSLESRAPLLDHRLIEFAWRLPMPMKMQGNVGKVALRNVLYKHVPQGLVERPKMGFSLPLAEWLRGPLRDWAEELLDENRLREQGYFRAKPVRTCWKEHLSGRRDWKFRLWNVLMFQAWEAERMSQSI